MQRIKIETCEACETLDRVQGEDATYFVKVWQVVAKVGAQTFIHGGCEAAYPQDKATRLADRVFDAGSINPAHWFQAT